MKVSALMIPFALALAAFAVVACAATAMTPTQHTHASPADDPITGEWAVKLTLQGTTVPATFKLKLEGDKVTGTANSEHTGPGTLTGGTWAHDKLSFNMNFEAHDSIAVTGTLHDGELSGEFRTEGMQGTWEARRK